MKKLSIYIALIMCMVVSVLFIMRGNSVIVGAQTTDTTTTENSTETTTQETTTSQEPTTKSGVSTGSSDTGGNSPYNIDISVQKGRNSDILMTNVSAPDGIYGGKIDFFFTLNTNYEFVAVSVDTTTNNFPFIKNESANKILVPSEWPDQPMNCSFSLDIKNDVKTGYYPINFCVEYIKHGHHMFLNEVIDVYIIGKPEETTTKEQTTQATTPAPTLPDPTPRVIIENYSVSVEKIYAGDEFQLNITLKNTSSDTYVNNLKFTLASANSEFLPLSGSSTAFVDYIGAGGSKTVSFNMKAQASLEQKPYVLTADMVYENMKNKEYTSKENISIPVYLMTKIKVSSVEINPPSIETGSQANVMFNVNNAGKGALSNVTVNIEGENVAADEVFIGNIAAGATGYADFMITGLSETKDDGTVKVIINYEDSAGFKGTYDTTINLYVYEPVYEEIPEYVPEEPVDEANFSKMIWIGIGVASVILIGLIVFLKLRKKKREAEELEDEIS